MESTDLPSAPSPGPDSWAYLRRLTCARIAQGRAGGSARTAPLLDFRLAHARARDAVHAPFDSAALVRRLEGLGIESECVATAATDRREYLARPDFGRTLSLRSQNDLRTRAADWGERDLVVIVSDGLSALAAHRQAPALLEALLPCLLGRGWSLYPVLVAPLARVKLQDQIGSIVGARQSLMLLGERPGLGSPDSLGAYFTWRPSPDRTDADRNCVSNIRPEGLPPSVAAGKLAALLEASAHRQTSGVALKDGAPHLRANTLG